MKRLLLAGAAALAVSTAAHADGPFYIGSAGMNCATFVQDLRAGKATGSNALFWAAGYMSGMEAAVFVVNPKAVSVMRTLDGATVEAGMVSYCTKNPVDTVGLAANWLMQTRITQLTGKPA